MADRAEQEGARDQQSLLAIGRREEPGAETGDAPRQGAPCRASDRPGGAEEGRRPRPRLPRHDGAVDKGERLPHPADPEHRAPATGREPVSTRPSRRLASGPPRRTLGQPCSPPHRPHRASRPRTGIDNDGVTDHALHRRRRRSAESAWARSSSSSRVAMMTVDHFRCDTAATRRIRPHLWGLNRQRSEFCSWVVPLRFLGINSCPRYSTASPPPRRPPQTVEDFVGVKIDPERRRGRGRRVQPLGPLREAEPRTRRRRLGKPRRPGAVPRPLCRRSGRARSSPPTISPTSPSTARSTPIGAASTAASTASRAPPTPIWACRRASISRPSCSPSPTPPSLLEKELAKPELRAAHHRHRHQHRPLPADRGALRASRASVLEVLERRQPSGRHRHQVGAGARATSTSWRAHGRARPRQGGALGDDARPQACPRAWSRARRRRAPSRGDPPSSEAGVPTTVMVAPIIPALNDSEIERILDAAAGRRRQGGRLRPPAPALEVRDVFKE